MVVALGILEPVHQDDHPELFVFRDEIQAAHDLYHVRIFYKTDKRIVDCALCFLRLLVGSSAIVCVLDISLDVLCGRSYFAHSSPPIASGVGFSAISLESIAGFPTIASRAAEVQSDESHQSQPL